MNVLSRAYAKKKDEEDLLAPFRDQFLIPNHNGRQAIYFCGNSLGLQPNSFKEYILEEQKVWANHGVNAHFESKRPWMNFHEFIINGLTHVTGALASELAIMNALTVNLHLLFTSFYRPKGNRTKILMEKNAFSSDIFMISTHLEARGFNPNEVIVYLEPDEETQIISTEQISDSIKELGESLSIVFLGGTNFYSGQHFDIPSITRQAHDVGALAGFDLAHTIGNIPLQLHDWEVDFASWCSYKYLNSGPGAVSSVFIHEQHAKNTQTPRYGGWWGQPDEIKFGVNTTFAPLPTAGGWQASNEPIFNMIGLMASLEIFESANINALRRKSIQLTSYLEELLLEIDPHMKCFKIITPNDQDARGCQLSLWFKKDGDLVFEALNKTHVVADFRRPSVIRISPTPLYNSFEDIFNFFKIFNAIIKKLFS